MIKATENNDIGGKVSDNGKTGPNASGPFKTPKSNSQSKDIRDIFQKASGVENDVCKVLSSSSEESNNLIQIAGGNETGVEKVQSSSNLAAIEPKYTTTDKETSKTRNKRREKEQRDALDELQETEELQSNETLSTSSDEDDSDSAKSSASAITIPTIPGKERSVPKGPSKGRDGSKPNTRSSAKKIGLKIIPSDPPSRLEKKLLGSSSSSKNQEQDQTAADKPSMGQPSTKLCDRPASPPLEEKQEDHNGRLTICSIEDGSASGTRSPQDKPSSPSSSRTPSPVSKYATSNQYASLQDNDEDEEDPQKDEEASQSTNGESNTASVVQDEEVEVESQNTEDDTVNIKPATVSTDSSFISSQIITPSNFTMEEFIKQLSPMVVAIIGTVVQGLQESSTQQTQALIESFSKSLIKSAPKPKSKKKKQHETLTEDDHSNTMVQAAPPTESPATSSPAAHTTTVTEPDGAEAVAVSKSSKHGRTVTYDSAVHDIVSTQGATLHQDTPDVAPTEEETVDYGMPQRQVEQYSFYNNSVTQQQTTAVVYTNLLLISRINRKFPLKLILSDLSKIGNLMGVDIDLEEFTRRSKQGQGTFQNEGNRKAIVVQLKDTHTFSTLGVLCSDILPLFIYTQKGSSSDKTTTNRLTVQAIPAGSPFQSSALFEVAAVRGFPDCSQLTSILFSSIVLDILQKTTNHNLFFQIYSTPNERTLRGKRSYVEEMFIRTYSFDTEAMDLVRSLALSSSNDTTPVPYRVKSWQGVISKTLSGFLHSPTNITDLRTPVDVLVIPRMTGMEGDDYQNLQPYFTLDVTSEDTEFPAAMGYFRGSIEEPNCTDPSTAMVILFPEKGDFVPFALERWNKDHPPQSKELKAAYVSMPGRDKLMEHYAVNPVPWSNSIEVLKPSFGKGITIPPPKELVPASVAVVVPSQSSKRKRQGQQSNSVGPPVSLHSILHPSTASTIMVQPKQPLVFPVTSATAVVTQRSALVKPPRFPLPPNVVVTKQAGDALVSRDLKLDAVIVELQEDRAQAQANLAQANLDRAMDRAQADLDRKAVTEDRDNNARLFARLFAKLDKMDEKSQE